MLALCTDKQEAHFPPQTGKPYTAQLSKQFLFQLAELHIYLVPREAWESQRNLAKKSVVDDCVSVGFVRYETLLCYSPK